LGSQGLVGKLWQSLTGGHLAFTFTGLVIGSVIFSLPFAVHPLQNAFNAIGTRPLEVAATLRAGPLDRFVTVIIPLARPGFLTAIALTFSHTVGEFGMVLMIGGSIPGKTQVLSIAIYEHVEMADFQTAHILSGGMLIFSFVILVILYTTNKRLG
jgi:molybdate transport system permease protein